MHLLSQIERHLIKSGTPPTRFGRQVVGDPRFVHDLRRGREPGAAISRRVRQWLAAADRQEHGR